jgi:hypothetical protein
MEQLTLDEDPEVCLDTVQQLGKPPASPSSPAHSLLAYSQGPYVPDSYSQDKCPRLILIYWPRLILWRPED